ncbi:MAG: hypothetical protein P8X74_09315, partial [Reinekea sp.]
MHKLLSMLLLFLTLSAQASISFNPGDPGVSRIDSAYLVKRNNVSFFVDRHGNPYNISHGTKMVT